MQYNLYIYTSTKNCLKMNKKIEIFDKCAKVNMQQFHGPSFRETHRSLHLSIIDSMEEYKNSEIKGLVKNIVSEWIVPDIDKKETLPNKGEEVLVETSWGLYKVVRFTDWNSSYGSTFDKVWFLNAGTTQYSLSGIKRWKRFSKI